MLGGAGVQPRLAAGEIAEGELPPSWPTAWASIGGGLLFAFPFTLGLLDGVGVNEARAPWLHSPALLTLGAGLGLLLISLYGWWTLARRSLVARMGIATLAVGYGMWL